jgi:predicted ATPase/signal transduction histidine kinase
MDSAPENSVNKGQFRTIRGKDGDVYRIVELVAITAGSTLYRARPVEGGSAVLVKAIAADAMLPVQNESFRKEYEALLSLDITGVIKPIALIDQPLGPVMILEDVEGEPLESVLTGPRLDWPTCFRMTSQLVHVLAGLHTARLVHRDIRPANLMVMPEDKICLTDLHYATRETSEKAMETNPSVGDWAYTSPELTGRLNRSVDYRSDFYSLGVTLYRMLAGQLPFHADDPLEWAHCHIARMPRPPAELNADIPLAVSDIVMKLLEKMPEDRYQSAHGLLHDLRTCLQQWEMSGAVLQFAVGALDRSQRIRLSHQLFGREAEVKQLMASHEEMALSGRPALLLVSGEAGVGKSALVGELHQAIGARHGYFISGKFDQYQRDIPYATITQAFRDLVQQILADSAARIAHWRLQIQNAVGPNGQLIVDVLPQVALIIGPQAPVTALPAAEAQNRFLNIFQQFIGVFAQSAHPLTLFLDDLQWADAASLRLVRELVTSSEKRFLLVVGAYRDNEVGPAHPLTSIVDQLRSDGAIVRQLELGNLSQDALSIFVDDVLRCGRDTATPLAHLIYQKTLGNPFFVIQFITALTDEHMITFDADAKIWRWDLPEINAKGYTDNVAEFMIDKLLRLPVLTQATLQRIACLGSGADESTLVTVCDQPQAITESALAQAVYAGLLLRASGTVKFTHDRVQEAAYLSMPPSVRTALHLEIGHMLMADKTQSQIEDAIFFIVSQFNRGADGMTGAVERALLCHLNFVAGKKAKAAIAYASARTFLDQAFALLAPDAWQGFYRDTFALTLALSECEFLMGNFDRADALTELLLANAQSNRDRASVYRLRTQLYQMAGRYDDALTGMFEAARLFNVSFPAAGPEMEAAIDADVCDIATFLEGRRIADFADAPPLRDAELETVIALLVDTIPAAYLTRPDCFALITAKATKLSLRFGCTEDACFAYSTFGMALLARQSDVALAFEYSELALRLNERLDGRRLKGRVLVAHALAFSPWKNSFGSSTPILDQAAAASLEVGDLLYANFAALFYCWPMLQQGVPLDTVFHTAREQATFAHDNHNDAVYQAIRFQQQLAANLKGKTRGPASLDDDEFDASVSYAALEKANMGFGLQIAHIVNQISAFVYGDYERALVAARQASLYSYEGNGMILVDSAHHFYFALTLAALYPQASCVDQRDFAALLAQELERHKVWAEYNPQNFVPSHALIGAEIARIEGRESDAERLYEQSIRAARESGFVHIEALTFEVASRFYRSRGFELIADTYLREARAGYLHWGADGKVAQLDTDMPQLHPGIVTASRPARSQASVEMSLDVLSVIKASQAISGRIVLDELADTLLKIALQSAGAQTGCLLLCGSDEGLEMAAEANVDRDTVQVQFHQRHAPTEADLPAAILNYVQRSREHVLLPDVSKSNPYENDPYFAGRDPKSVLCLPILQRQRLVGVLYLENRLVTHSIAPERIPVLELLASQAAISLENARLYDNLLRENSERKRAEDALREADRRKDEFLAMLAHELRNPLAPISAAAHLLRVVSNDDARVQHASETIARQVDHMTGLINDLLDVSRVTSGRVELDTQPVDIEQIVMESVEQVRPLIEARRHRLTLHTLSEAAFVVGDRKRLVQVMANLLNNAAKYTPEGGQIALRMQAEDDRVRLIVADDGIGMAAEMVLQAFELFAQAERTSDRTQGGLGLGLALVKSLVELHKGGVSVHSNGIGAGSEFTVTLPRLITPLLPSSRSQVDLPRAQYKSLRLLVVDDNVDAAFMLGMLLEASGYEVFIAHDAETALRRARIEPPDACLLDIGLPDIDGNELARQLRSRPETAASLLIAITGYGPQNQRGLSEESAFSHHFVKPVDSAALLTILGKLSLALKCPASA